MSNKVTDTYTHCTLYKYPKLSGETTLTVSWIPSKFAIKGKIIALKTKDIWEDWCVQSIGNTMDAAYVEEHRDDYRHQREASDI